MSVFAVETFWEYSVDFGKENPRNRGPIEPDVVDAVTARLAVVIGDDGTGWGLVGGGGGGVVWDEDDAPLQLERKAEAATAADPCNKRRRVKFRLPCE